MAWTWRGAVGWKRTTCSTRRPRRRWPSPWRRRSNLSSFPHSPWERVEGPQPRASKLRRFLPDQLVGVRQRFERARLGPVAAQLCIPKPSLPQVMAVDVGDFQLPPAARLQRLDHVENVRRIEVDPGYREIALRLLWLFLDADNAVAAEFRDAVALRVVDLL